MRFLRLSAPEKLSNFGDDSIDGISYSKMAGTAKAYIRQIGGFERYNWYSNKNFGGIAMKLRSVLPMKIAKYGYIIISAVFCVVGILMILLPAPSVKAIGVFFGAAMLVFGAVKLVAKMLKAIHAQKSKKAAHERAKAVVAELRAMKLKEAAQKIEDGVEETLTYADFPSEHWTRIRTNNVIERLNREIRRRTRVVGCFPDGNSALMLVCARLRHPVGRPEIHEYEASGGLLRRCLCCHLISFTQSLYTNLRINLDTTCRSNYERTALSFFYLQSRENITFI